MPALFRILRLLGIVAVVAGGVSIVVIAARHEATEEDDPDVALRLAVADLSPSSLLPATTDTVDLTVTTATGDGDRTVPFDNLRMLGRFAADGRPVADGEEQPHYLIVCVPAGVVDRLRDALRKKQAIDLTESAQGGEAPATADGRRCGADSPSMPAPSATPRDTPAPSPTPTPDGAARDDGLGAPSPTPPPGIPVPSDKLRTNVMALRDGESVEIVLVFPRKELTGTGDGTDVARYRGVVHLFSPPSSPDSAAAALTPAQSPTASSSPSATLSPNPSPARIPYIVPALDADGSVITQFVRRLHAATAVFLLQE
jgi:hypothetical protein